MATPAAVFSAAPLLRVLFWDTLQQHRRMRQDWQVMQPAADSHGLPCVLDYIQKHIYGAVGTVNALLTVACR